MEQRIVTAQTAYELPDVPCDSRHGVLTFRSCRLGTVFDSPTISTPVPWIQPRLLGEFAALGRDTVSGVGKVLLYMSNCRVTNTRGR